jgi:Pilin (bacterial filament)
MSRVLLNFAVIFVAVLAALLIYSKLSGNKNPAPAAVQEVQDFGVGEIRARKDALTEGFRMADGVKTAFSEYYSNTGKMPEGNQDIGVPPPESYQGKSVKRIEASEQGITVIYNEQSGVDDGRILFYPEAKEGNIDWKCSSPSFRDIKRIAPICDYRKESTP